MKTHHAGAILAALTLVAASLGVGAQPRARDAIVYTIRFPDPASHTFTVDAVIPTEKRATVDLMMPVWSPGFYALQSYAGNVTSFSATAGAVALDVTKPTPNRWRVTTGGRA